MTEPTEPTTEAPPGVPMVPITGKVMMPTTVLAKIAHAIEVLEALDLPALCEDLYRDVLPFTRAMYGLREPVCTEAVEASRWDVLHALLTDGASAMLVAGGGWRADLTKPDWWDDERRLVTEAEEALEASAFLREMGR